MRKIYLIFICFVACAAYAKVSKKSFLITEEDSVNRVSKNELKENIGEKLKQVLHACTSIADELGRMQRKLAALQRGMLNKVESLVENKRCFKKASRKDLSDAFDIMSSIKKQLRSQQNTIKQMSLNMNKNKCLREKKQVKKQA